MVFKKCKNAYCDGVIFGVGVKEGIEKECFFVQEYWLEQVYLIRKILPIKKKKGQEIIPAQD